MNSKYNITEKKEKAVNYITTMSPAAVEKIYEQIMLKFVVEKKYRDPRYTAARMAREIGYNTRYISAVMHLRFRDNFSQLINSFRVREAMYMLTDKHFSDKSAEEIGLSTGFSSRQSFYAAFFRMNNMTPVEYRTSMNNKKHKSDKK
ncbi:MAG: AraC family transcriptional regulator [Bacteroidaceae bacterium]|nr:AraC family transcriptional regulator [Bacteroidaceae bacterium]MBR1467449.1 AraC family transcriptional regulator [Bacteroidaceae bacterium]